MSESITQATNSKCCLMCKYPKEHWVPPADIFFSCGLNGETLTDPPDWMVYAETQLLRQTCPDYKDKEQS